MAGKNTPVSGRKVVCRNKRAFRDYFIQDRLEAGMILLGSEVKSLRDGRASLSDSYAEVRNTELFLVNSHISEYPQASYFNHDPLRERKLLLHQHEIHRLGVKLNERGFTLIPLELYFVRGKAKVELGLAKGKRQYDKRNAVKQRDIDRDMQTESSRRR
ncbi:MAG: SsrA-binding protein SmpB [Pseudomonadota bacterium]